MSSEQSIRCDVCGDALKEPVRSETEDKKHKNHQGFDAY